VKQWEEDDFYASDEDEFLDRTGSIEKKRRNRMKLAGREQDVVETFDSLSKKHEETVAELRSCEEELAQAVDRRDRAAARSETSDLDSYLAELRRGAQVDKETIQKLKMKIIHLKQEKEVGFIISLSYRNIFLFRCLPAKFCCHYS
jgi:protein phosphatase 1D